MEQLKKQIESIVLRSRKPISLTAIGSRAGLGREERKQIRNILSQLEKEGRIHFVNGRYASPKVAGLKKTGRIHPSEGKPASSKTEGLTPCKIVKVNATFGFAKPIEEGLPDLFIPGRFLMGTLPGDQVLVKIGRSASGEALTEGQVVQVLEEANTPFSALLTTLPMGKLGIEPDSYVGFSFPLAKSSAGMGRIGDKVLALVRRKGTRHNNYTAEILEVFGSADSAANNAKAILAEYSIFPPFSLEVRTEAENIGQMTTIHPKEIAHRLDLRQENVFTIDGAETKDIDDAISLTPLSDGWELGVHIADVTYYVQRNSPLDNEAFTRGTSVYFANQVVPMLPPELSNGICSLNPQADRLAFSAFIKLDKVGQIHSYRFEKTVIRSRLQGVYSEINDILNKKASSELLEKYKEQLDTLFEMETLATLLKKNRSKRHSINLESTESKIVVNEQGIAVDILPRETGVSEGIIEEFMLTANEAAATFAMKEKIPFVFRVHEPPAQDRLEALFQLLDQLGVAYQRPKENQSAASALSDVLEKVKGTPVAEIINHSMLRTMSKAQYDPENKGHFGLGLANYAHFTSPIRRYPDLAIHRILSGLQTGMRRDNIERNFRSWVKDVSLHSTQREIASMTAERNIEDCYKAEYMKPFVGQEFSGVISSATSFGIFIKLPNTVEGLIHQDRFPPGRWQYDQSLTHSNEVGGATLSVGDPLKVILQSVTISSGQIDFAFAHPENYTGDNNVPPTNAKAKRKAPVRKKPTRRKP